MPSEANALLCLVVFCNPIGKTVDAPACEAETTQCKKKVNQSHYRPEVPTGFQEVKVPTLHDNGTAWW